MLWVQFAVRHMETFPVAEFEEIYIYPLIKDKSNLSYGILMIYLCMVWAKSEKRLKDFMDELYQNLPL